METTAYLEYHHHRIAYQHLSGDGPTLVFLPGLMSDMMGTKASFLHHLCTELGWPYLRFDYRGHGQSSGKLEECKISDWLHDCLYLIGEVTDGPLMLVGSSLGGWLMMHVAKRLEKRVKALVGIAAAPDFTEYLIWGQLSEEDQSRLVAGEIIYLPSNYSDSGYPLSYDFIEDARALCVLEKKLDILCPIRLLHGLDDSEVPYLYAEKLLLQCQSEDGLLMLVKNGDHRLSRHQDLTLLRQTLVHLRERIS